MNSATNSRLCWSSQFGMLWSFYHNANHVPVAISHPSPPVMLSWAGHLQLPRTGTARPVCSERSCRLFSELSCLMSRIFSYQWRVQPGQSVQKAAEYCLNWLAEWAIFSATNDEYSLANLYRKLQNIVWTVLLNEPYFQLLRTDIARRISTKSCRILSAVSLNEPYFQLPRMVTARPISTESCWILTELSCLMSRIFSYQGRVQRC